MKKSKFSEEQMVRILKEVEAGAKVGETCRKVDPGKPFLRELLISFGRSGYVALFEIDDGSTVTITAVRHQREEDYH